LRPVRKRVAWLAAAAIVYMLVAWPLPPGFYDQIDACPTVVVLLTGLPMVILRRRRQV
jgi:hypothetical protein